MSQLHDDPKSTSKIQTIASAEIAKQAAVCEANLNRVRDKITSMNGDMGDIATQLRELSQQVASLTISVVQQIADLTLAMNQQISAVKAETRKLTQRWSIWPTLKEILIVIVTLASLALSVYVIVRG